MLFLCNGLKHRGKILEQAVRKSGFAISQLAKKLDYDRTSVYRHFETDDLDYRIIAQYGQMLHHDFSAEFPEMESYMVERKDPLLVHGPQSMTDAIGEIDRWRSKYIDLLEQFTELMAKHNALLEDRHRDRGERVRPRGEVLATNDH